MVAVFVVYKDVVFVVVVVGGGGGNKAPLTVLGLHK